MYERKSVEVSGNKYHIDDPNTSGFHFKMLANQSESR